MKTTCHKIASELFREKKMKCHKIAATVNVVNVVNVVHEVAQAETLVYKCCTSRSFSIRMQFTACKHL